MRWIVKRWEDLGGTEPTQYILPHHNRRSKEEKDAHGHKRVSPPIFTEPMGQIYRAARGILADAGLSHLDPYDMRSHAITKILSDPDCSDQVYTEIAGHVGNAMKRRYSKQRMEKKRGVTDRMCEGQVRREIAAAELEAKDSTGLLPPPAPAAAVPTPAPTAAEQSSAAIQLEIQRQVAQQVAIMLAVQQQLAQHVPLPTARPTEEAVYVRQTRPKLVSFPGPHKRA
jgi:hypothetical protein